LRIPFTACKVVKIVQQRIKRQRFQGALEFESANRWPWHVFLHFFSIQLTVITNDVIVSIFTFLWYCWHCLADKETYNLSFQWEFFQSAICCSTLSQAHHPDLRITV